jgi:hypothetical protein
MAWGNGDILSISFRLKIAEWASSALNLGQGAQEYYVSNSLTDTAAGAVNAVGGTVYGPAGSAILSINSTALSNTSSFYMTPMYPFQSNDLAVLEVTNNGSQWLPVASGNYAVANQGSSFYGVGLTFVTSTLLIVEFGNGGFRANNATYGLAGQAWSALAGSRWRVRVCKASSPVGFGLANVDGSAGLYKAGSAPGQTTGAAIASGYVGEVIRASNALASVGATSTYANGNSITLTPGIWAIKSQMTFNRNGATLNAANIFIHGVTTTSGNSGVGLDFSSTQSWSEYNNQSASYWTLPTINFTVRFDGTTITRIDDNTAFAAGAILYQKIYIEIYSVATPRYQGSITATRIA